LKFSSRFRVKAWLCGATTQIFYDRIGTHLSSKSLIHTRCDMRMVSRIVPSVQLREIVTWVLLYSIRDCCDYSHLIDGLSGAERKLSNKRNTTLLWKKYDIIVSLNSENGAKVAKVVKDFYILIMTLTAVLKNKDKIISHLSQNT